MEIRIKKTPVRHQGCRKVAGEGAYDKHGQEEAAGNAGAVAQHCENKFCAKNYRYSCKGEARLGDRFNQLAAAAKHLGQVKAEDACYNKRKGNAAKSVFKKRQSVKHGDIDEAIVEDCSKNTKNNSQDNREAEISERHHRQINKVENSSRTENQLRYGRRG